MKNFIWSILLLLLTPSLVAQENIATTANTVTNSNYTVIEIIGDNFNEHHFSNDFSIEHSMLSVDVINKAEDNIEFNLPDILYVNESPFTLTASSESGLDVSYRVIAGDGQVVDNILTFSSPDILIIEAFHNGNNEILSASIFDTVTVLGVYTFSGMVIKPDNDPLSNGIAKLHGLSNHEVYSSNVVDGVYDFGIIKAGEYVLHVVPNGTEGQEVFHTYYNEQQFSQDAETINVINDVNLQVMMLPKENNNNGNGGNGVIRGRIVTGAAGGRSRVIVGRILEGEGLELIPIYLLDINTNGIITSVLTDSTGFFEMTQIASGAYTFRIDVVGVSLENSTAIINFDEDDGILEVSAEISEEGIVFTEEIILSTQINNISPSISIFPNPNNGIVNIEADSNTKLLSIHIYDMMGRLMFSENRNLASFSFDIQGLADGLYLLKISTDKGKSNHRLVLKK